MMDNGSHISNNANIGIAINSGGNKNSVADIKNQGKEMSPVSGETFHASAKASTRPLDHRRR